MPIPAELFEAIRPYTDRYGFVSNLRDPSSPSGNALMFSSEWELILKDNGITSYEPNLPLLTITPGLYRRTPVGEPFSQDVMRWDDYIGLAAVSRDAAQAIVDYGKTHFFHGLGLGFRYYYDPSGLDTEWESWFGRSPAIIAHFEWGAGLTPPLWRRVAWSLAIATSGIMEPEGQDPWRISYLMIRACQSPGALERLAILAWKLRFAKAWPGGMRAVRARYFNDPNHPLSVYVKDIE